MGSASGPADGDRNAASALFDRSPAAVCVVCGSTIVYANNACLRIFGVSTRAEIEEHPAAEFLAPDAFSALQHVSGGTVENAAATHHSECLRADGRVLLSESWPVTWKGAAAAAIRVALQTGEAAPGSGSLNIGTWDHDLETGEMNWSEGQYRIHGLEPFSETPSYRLWESRIHPEDIVRVEAAIENARRNASDFDVDYRAVWPDGGVHWINARGHCFSDDAGRLVRMSGVFAQVGTSGELDRTRALKKELEQRVEDFETLFHLMPVGLAVSRDPECRDVRVNPELARILGVGTEQNTSKSGPDADRLPFRLLDAGREVPAGELPQQKAQSTSRPVGPVELEVVRNDGAVRYMYGSAVPLFAEGGRVRGSIAAYVDTTERRTVENRLRDAMQRLETHLQNSPLAVIEFGSNFDVIRWSDAAERMFGWTAGEITGKRIDEMRWVHEDDLEAVRRRSDDMSSGRGYRVVGYNRNYHRDGRILFCEWYNSALLDESGRLKSVLSLVLDVTARKRAEERLGIQARQLAATNQELQQFAHMTSHDLQEPLRTVLAFSELVRRKTEDPLQREHLAFVIAAAARMSRLIENLLQFARAGEPDAAAKSPVSMRQVLDDIKSNLQTTIADSKAEIVCPELPVVTGVREDLMRLMQNLVANAIKYRREAVRPRIIIDVRSSGNEYVFCVEDNGEGFDSSKADDVFIAFRRLHPHKEKGTGLGLAICKKIVEKHGGRIWAEGIPGVGAKFSFSLPRS